MLSTSSIRNCNLKNVEIRDLQSDIHVVDFKSDDGSYATVYFNEKLWSEFDALMATIGHQKADILIHSHSVSFMMTQVNVVANVSEICKMTWEPYWIIDTPVPML